MIADRKDAVIRALKGYVRRFIPPGEFFDDCISMIIRAEVHDETVTELNKLIEEAQTARAKDEERIEQYKNLLRACGISDPAACVEMAIEETPKFKVGDRVLYSLRPHENLWIPVTVISIGKRVRVKDVGRYGLTRNVAAKNLKLDPNPSPDVSGG
jgi:hypothetical protein